LAASRRLALTVESESGGIVRLRGVIPTGLQEVLKISYPTRTGALLRINGAALAAFDREHGDAVCSIAPDSHVTLEVEERSLPTSGLPSGNGLQWWLLNLFASQRPARAIGLCAAPDPLPGTATPGYPLFGHAHLDVAWLWTYAEAQRKAQRTFAIAANLLREYRAFVFSQSQPQLYEFVRSADPQFFERLRPLVQEGRFDASIAALWVEPDCNLPSGESLLRQMLHAHQFTREHFNQAPQVAWLPDSFGFANTLPTLLEHAGIPYFATTKLQWNDTTRFPNPQFRWRGPDGSEVLAALLDSYDGAPTPARVARAKARNEPVVAGYGDGGGGVTEAMIADAQSVGTWTRPVDWFATLDRDKLPVHRDELYLEYHRGVYTSHHDAKSRNAALERDLLAVEETVAWCMAIKTPRELTSSWNQMLHEAWTIVLRNQFHDVLPGTSIGGVYEDVHREYDRAQRLVDRIRTSTRAVLPRGRARPPAPLCQPVQDANGNFALANGLIEARVHPDGTLEHLALSARANVVSEANALRLYEDRPRKWEAWNIDSGYSKTAWRPQPGPPSIKDGALIVPFTWKRSSFSMRIHLLEGEPFLRVALHCDWRERHTLLRVENLLSFAAPEVRYGTPHGTVARSTANETPAEQAQFEVPGQRFAAASAGSGGLAILARDTYGWSGKVADKGLRLGHSLLRAPMWPQRDADVGEHRIEYAFVPLTKFSVSEVEALWERFALEPRVRLFRPSHPAVIVVACKPACDGDGVVMRLRECDGAPAQVHLQCGARMRSAGLVDALERPAAGACEISGESVRVEIPSLGLRSLRVRF